MAFSFKTLLDGLTGGRSRQPVKSASRAMTRPAFGLSPLAANGSADAGKRLLANKAASDRPTPAPARLSVSPPVSRTPVLQTSAKLAAPKNVALKIDSAGSKEAEPDKGGPGDFGTDIAAMPPPARTQARRITPQYATPVTATAKAVLPAGTERPPSRSALPLGRRAVATEDVVAMLLNPRFDASVVSAEGGEVATTEAQRQVACFLSNGWLLITKHDHLNVHAMQLKADIARARKPITQEYLVDLEVIRKIYKRHDESFGVTTLGAKINGAEAEEFQREFLLLIGEAQKLRSSDIHVAVGRFEANIRMRSDGQIKFIRQVGALWANSLLAAAFNMADSSDAAYRPLECQFARISNIGVPLPNGIQTIRLQFAPLSGGGRYMVCRLLGEASSIDDGEDLDTYGYNKCQLQQLRSMRKRPHGVVIISGPTGSGKSTTLQRLVTVTMREKPGYNGITIEDPSEYVIPSVAQLLISGGLSEEDRREKYRQAISASLRLDPDLLMIGEIRDRASSSMAFEAGMTGHQVLTSLHANDSVSILDRLRDQGVEDYKLCDPSLVIGLIGQRLIRRLCDRCKIRFCDAPQGAKADANLDRAVRRAMSDHYDSVFSCNPAGCEHCDGGYTGRTAIAECIVPDLKFMQHVRLGHKEEAIEHWLTELEGLTISEHAAQKIARGICDPRDVEIITGDLARFNLARSEAVFGKLFA